MLPYLCMYTSKTKHSNASGERIFQDLNEKRICEYITLNEEIANLNNYSANMDMSIIVCVYFTITHPKRISLII